MKKKTFILPFKSNFFKEQDPFHLVVIFFIIFFGTAIFFSIPTFYDYKKYNDQIERTINNEFKIKIHNLKDISFRFIPSPHLLIKKAHLKINENEKDIVSEFKNLKVYISLIEFYKKEKFSIKRIEVSRANLYLNKKSLINFISNLKNNIVNNFIIRKSKLFFKDKNDEIILISTIKNFDYKIDYVNNKKILKIDGNIFDSQIKFRYLIDYKFPNVQNLNFEFKNPNLVIDNELVDDINKKPLYQKGNLILSFLSNKNVINYEILNNNINFKNESSKNSNFDLNGSINLNPFHFDLILDLKEISLINLENLLYLIYINENMKLENLSGTTKLNFEKIDNKVLQSGELEMQFTNSKLFTKKKIFHLNNFAKLQVIDYQYLTNNDQILEMDIKIDILDKEKFNRFLFNFKKNKILSDSLYLTYQYNVNTKNSFISRISDSGFTNSNEFYKFRNLQQLKNLLKDKKVFILE